MPAAARHIDDTQCLTPSPKNPLSGPSKTEERKVLKTLSAGVAKLVDARDLKSLGFGCAGSIPAARTR
jgi:hypothetical protein